MAKGYAADLVGSFANCWKCDYAPGIKYNLVNTDFTYEAWIQPHGASAVEASGKLEDQSGDWAFYQAGTGMNVLLYSSDGAHVFLIKDPIDTTTLHHFAMVWDNTSKLMHYFYDGTEVGTGSAVSGTFPATSTSRFWIGRVGTIGAEWTFDELRVSNVKRYTSNFTPSVTPFVDDANTIILCHFDEGTGNDTADSAHSPLTFAKIGSPPYSWDVGAVDLPPEVHSVTKDLLYYIIKTPAAKNTTITYDLAVPVGKTKSLRYVIDVPKLIQENGSYVLQEDSDYIVIGHYMFVPPIQTKALRYYIIFVPSAKEESLKYTIIKYVAGHITKSSEYVVATQTTPVVSLTYMVIAPHIKTKNLTYTNILAAIEITKSMGYTLYATFSKTESLQYVIHSYLKPQILSVENLKPTVSAYT
jgi:hypothetical protein